MVGEKITNSLEEILRSALGLQGEITEAKVHKGFLKVVDRPVRMPDGRVLVLRRRPAENPLDDKFWIEKITPQ